MFNKTHINTLEEVNEFFTYLYQDLGLNFHPDDEFNSYIDPKSDSNPFSSAECELYDLLMKECFDVCEKSNVDIYGEALAIHTSMV